MMFKPLTRENIRGIVDIQFQGLQKMLKTQGVSITASEEALDWLGEIGYDPQFGARPLKRAMQREVLNPLSKDILSGKITAESVIKLGLSGKAFVFENDGNTTNTLE
jgi:ATP-dependent Clp protease ATP-binding subunit ClpB